MKQQTVAAPIELRGVGLHTGTDARLRILPAPADAGLTFVVGAVRVPATAEYVVDTSRATVLGRDGVSVSTTEHLLSALFALGVDNADLELAGCEVPVLDGSARRFVEAIRAVGLRAQAAERRTIAIDRPLALQNGDRVVTFLPAPALRVRFLADFPAPIGTQYYDGVVDPQAYEREIAGARTFGYLHEVEALRQRGLALGGSLENALVFAPDGPLQPLRWPNEVVRHKVLDLLGDLALLGAWPLCDVIAIKSGHELHALATRALRARALDAAVPGVA